MLLQGREHAAMVHLSGPRLWRRPWVGVGLHRVGSARQEQLHQFDTAPPTGPPEWRALEQVVTQAEASTRIEDQGGESHALVGGWLAQSGNAVEDGEAELGAVGDSSTDVRIAALQNQAKADSIGGGVPVSPGPPPPPGPTIPTPHRLFEDGKPAGIVARPVDVLEGQSHDLRITATRRGIEKPFGRHSLVGGLSQ